MYIKIYKWSHENEFKDHEDEIKYIKVVPLRKVAYLAY